MEKELTAEELRIEQQQIRLLIQRGVDYPIPNSALFPFIKKTVVGPDQTKTRVPRWGDRVIKLREPFLGTLDLLSEQYIKLGFSEAAVQAEGIDESRRLVARNAKIMAKIVAIAVLRKRGRIRLFSGIVARYFLWHITPSKLHDLVMLINTISNLPDFTNSIRLIYPKRTTAPNRIEEGQAV